MSLSQKLGRILLVTATLTIGSILVAMLGALGLFLAERGRELGDAPQFFDGLGIIIVAVGVNIICVLMLLQIRKADTRLMSKSKLEGQPPA